MGEDGKNNIEEADWKNFFPDTHRQTNGYTGIKISNAEDVSDFFTSVLPFTIDRSGWGYLYPVMITTLTCSWNKLKMALLIMPELLQYVCKLQECFSGIGRCKWNKVLYI